MNDSTDIVDAHNRFLAFVRSIVAVMVEKELLTPEDLERADKVLYPKYLAELDQAVALKKAEQEKAAVERITKESPLLAVYLGLVDPAILDKPPDENEEQK